MKYTFRASYPNLWSKILSNFREVYNLFIKILNLNIIISLTIITNIVQLFMF